MAAAGCSARSGERTAALVELYTSEGCSSCPPAERWLSSLGRQGFARDQVVPLALHVDYWDYLGWKDPYAKRAFSARQRKLTALQRLALVYTPQVLLQGRDFRGWATEAFDEAVRRINATTAEASLRLTLHAVGETHLDVEAGAAVREPGQAKHAGLYLAVYENRLLSRVLAGENRGRDLTHDHVVLEWRGPFRFDGRARIRERQRLPLLPGAVGANSGIVGFVQNLRTAQVLQALMLPACANASESDAPFGYIPPERR